MWLRPFLRILPALNCKKTGEAVIRFPGYISPLFQVYWSLASSTPRVAVLKSATVFSRQAVSVG